MGQNRVPGEPQGQHTLGHGEPPPHIEEESELAKLASFVPPPYVRLLASSNPQEPPARIPFSGVVLFADISGFTKLTERLCQEGRVGAELLASTLTAYFGKVIDHISQHGGEVVKIAGDGLTALWAEEPAEAAAGFAVTCALSLQQALSATLPVHGVRMEMRIGIGFGAASLRQLGGYLGRWEFVFGGPALSRASLVCPKAAPSEVMLSQEVTALLGRHAHGVRLPEGGAMRVWELTEPPPPTPRRLPTLKHDMRKALRACLPSSILDRFDAGQSAWLTELRRVSVLFMLLPDLDVEGANDAQHLVSSVQRIIARYEGSINTLHVDEKGAMLLAVFGLPPLSHVDDALRGVRTALACQEVFHKRGERCAIGVTTGQAFCGTVGNAVRREYTVLGDVVNLSARMMSAAAISDGELPILCDATTYESTKTSIAFGTALSLTVKGKSKPISAFPPLRERLRHEYSHEPFQGSSRLLGRTAELETIKGCLQQLREQSVGGMLILEGPAGIGKSRLTEALLEQANSLGIITLIGSGDSIDRTSAYSAFTPLFRSLFGLPTEGIGGDARSVREQIGQVVPELCAPSMRSGGASRLSDVAEERERRLALLSAVLRMELTGVPHAQTEGWSATMAGRTHSEQLQTLLVQILRGVESRGPTLLLLNDTHWLDSVSWSLLFRLRRELPGLLIVLTTRPLADLSDSMARAEYQRMRQSPSAKLLVLQPLSKTETEIQLVERLGTKIIPLPLIEFVFEQTGGHPFFSEELLMALIDAGAVRVSDGICSLTKTPAELRGQHFPTTMHGVVQSRIDRLRPPQNLLLKIASVIGRTFSHQIIDGVHPIATDRTYLPDYLNDLEQNELTAKLSDEDLTYCFRHALIQEVAYGTLSFAQRKQLHLAVVDHLERRARDGSHGGSAYRVENLYPLLAYHYSQAAEHPHASADELNKAVVALLQSAEHGLRSGAAREALTQLDRALGLLQRLAATPSRDQLELALRVPHTIAIGIAQGYAASDTEQALQCCLELCTRVAAQQRTDWVEEVLPTLFGLWCCNLTKGRLWRARDISEQISRIALRDENPDTALAADLTQQVTCVMLGEFANALRLGASVLTRYDRYRHQHLTYLYGVDLQIMCLVHQGYALWSSGYAEQSQNVHEQAIALAEELGHPYSQGFALHGAAVHHVFRNDAATVSRFADELCTLGTQHGYGHTVLQGSFMRGFSMAANGQPAEGLSLMEQALAGRRRMGTLLTMPPLLAIVAERYLDCGQLDAAHAQIREALELMSSHGERFLTAEVLRVQAELLRRQTRGSFIEFALDGGPDDLFLRAIEIARCQKAGVYELRAVFGICRMWQTQGNQQEARRLLTQTLNQYRGELSSVDEQTARKLVQELS